MKKQFVFLFLILASVSLILTSILYTLSGKYREARTKRREEEKKLINKINDEITIQNKKVDDVYAKISGLKKDMMVFISTYEDMYKNHTDFFKKFKEVEDMISKSYDESKFLNDKCRNTYTSKATNMSCRNYYLRMEELTNTYVYIYNSISKKVDEYNEWFVKYKGTKKMGKITLFKTKYTKYVDLNNDKTFSGVIED